MKADRGLTQTLRFTKIRRKLLQDVFLPITKIAYLPIIPKFLSDNA